MEEVYAKFIRIITAFLYLIFFFINHAFTFGVLYYVRNTPNCLVSCIASLMELIILVWITGSYESPEPCYKLKTKSTKHTFPFRSIISWNEEKYAFLAKDLSPYLLLSTSHPIINASCTPVSWKTSSPVFQISPSSSIGKMWSFFSPLTLHGNILFKLETRVLLNWI